MSNYNEALIRALLGIGITWLMAAVTFNLRIEKMQRHYREIIFKQERELSRLRKQNSEQA